MRRPDTDADVDVLIALHAGRYARDSGLLSVSGGALSFDYGLD
jgi:hypothetical protein